MTGGLQNHIVWRENYTEGPLPHNVSAEEFARVRANFLHSCVPEYSEEQLRNFLLGQDRTLAELTARNTAVLWFDVCMFDTLMLARILFLLRNSPAEIRLFRADFVPDEHPEYFLQDWRTFPVLSPEIILLYAEAWNAVVSGPEIVARFNRENRAADPVLAEAMIRYGEDHPADGSPGKSELRLLELIRSGIRRPTEVFQAFNRMEPHPFMGDTTCRRLLESLAMQGRIASDGENLTFLH